MQLAGAVLLLGASWPVTKLALGSGATPAWFAAGRVGLSALAAAAALAFAGRLRVPGRVRYTAP